MTAHVLAVDMRNALGRASDDAQGVDPTKRRMTRVEGQSDTFTGYGQKAIQPLCSLDCRPKVVVVGEAQARLLDEVGDLGQTFAEPFPVVAAEHGRRRQRTVARAVDRIARLGDHEDRAAERLQQLEMATHGLDLGLGRTDQQFGAVPAAHQLEMITDEKGA